MKFIEQVISGCFQSMAGVGITRPLFSSLSNNLIIIPNILITKRSFQYTFCQWQAAASLRSLFSSLSLLKRKIPLCGQSMAGGDLALTMSSSPLLIEWVLSHFFRSMAGGSLTCSSVNFVVLFDQFQAETRLIAYSFVFFYGIARTGPFRIRSVNGFGLTQSTVFFYRIDRKENFIIRSISCKLQHILNTCPPRELQILMAEWQKSLPLIKRNFPGFVWSIAGGSILIFPLTSQDYSINSRLKQDSQLILRSSSVPLIERIFSGYVHSIIG